MEHGGTILLLFIQTVFTDPRPDRALGRMELAKMDKVEPCPPDGEGNGTRLQSSCMENPKNGGAWRAAVHGVATSRTRLSNFTFTFMHWRRKWQPTPGFLPGEFQGRGSLVGCHLWGRRESDTTEAS